MAEPLLQLWVAGRPRTKGSLKVISPRGRKPIMVEDHALSKPWRQTIINAVRKQHGVLVPSNRPIRVKARFFFEKNGPASQGMLWPMVNAGANAAGDLDKLLRNLLDAAEDAGVFANDCQVVEIRTSKEWSTNPGVLVTFEELDITDLVGVW